MDKAIQGGPQRRIEVTVVQEWTADGKVTTTVRGLKEHLATLQVLQGGVTVVLGRAITEKMDGKEEEKKRIIVVPGGAVPGVN